MNISIEQAIDIWNDLRDAMEGKASHGFDTEIYAYRLMPNTPGGDLRNSDYSSERRKAAQSLVQLIELFQEKYPTSTILIDGYVKYTWLNNIQDKFNHRVMVSLNAY